MLWTFYYSRLLLKKILQQKITVLLWFFLKYIRYEESLCCETFLELDLNSGRPIYACTVKDATVISYKERNWLVSK